MVSMVSAAAPETASGSGGGYPGLLSSRLVVLIGTAGKCCWGPTWKKGSWWLAGPRCRYLRGAVEWAVHAVVATAGAHGATVAEVVAAVVPTPSYTATVSTLQRLQSRGLLASRRVGRTTRYSATADSAADSAAATARWMHRLLTAAADRNRVLTEFLTGLAPDDEPRLLAALGERRIPQDPGATR